MRERNPSQKPRGNKQGSEKKSFDSTRKENYRREGRRSEEGTGSRSPSKRAPYDHTNADSPRSKGKTRSSKDETSFKPNTGKFKKSKPYNPNYKRPYDSKSLDDSTRLNKYLANAGLCTRREADELIKSGLVAVNGKTITEMGYKVQPGDEVKYAGERVKPDKPVYYLLNKPKDYTAEMRYTNDRKNALILLQDVENRHVQPVGKIDRATSGLVLYTNDGEMIMKLASSRFNLKKLFHVHLNKNLKLEDMQKLKEGLELKDGFVKASDVEYVGDKKDKRQIGIEVRSGKNKVVHRMLEELGYRIVKLDRVMYGELTKKDLPRGKWRELTWQEVINLKML